MKALALTITIVALASVAISLTAMSGENVSVSAAKKKHENLCDKHPDKKQCGGGGPSCDDPIPPPECCFPDCPASFTPTDQAHVTFVAKKTADEQADRHADKDHIKQADHTCAKAGFDGYFDTNNDGQSECGHLN